jgi:hypothetical protein
MAHQIPPTSKATLDTLERILGGTPNAHNALNAAYALGVIDSINRNLQPEPVKEAA